MIYSFISYLKISPVKLQIKMISKKADINKHLEQSQLELERETDPHCQELQRDYIQFLLLPDRMWLSLKSSTIQTEKPSMRLLPMRI